VQARRFLWSYIKSPAPPELYTKTQEVKGWVDTLWALVKLNNGDLLLAYNPLVVGRFILCIVVSKDEGKTWPLKFKKNIEIGLDEFSYPWPIEASDRFIHILILSI